MTKFRTLLQYTWTVAGLLIFSMPAFAEKESPSRDTSTKKQISHGAPTKLTDLEKSKLPAPSQKMLEDVLNKLKSVRLIDCELDQEGRLIGESGERLKEIGFKRVIFESSESMVLKELTELLRVRESSEYRYNFNCSPTLELTLVDGKVVYLGVIGGGVLRWKKWRSDAFLLNTLGFIRWLARHGFTKPAREVQERLDYAIYEYEKEKTSFDEFLRTMPKSLQVFFGTIVCLESSACLEDMSIKYGKIPEEKRLILARSALSHQFSNESDEIGALLEWDGRLTNCWASYQSFPIVLLLEYDPNQVLSKVKENSLSPAQWVGISRYFSSYYFKRKFPSGSKPLNKAFKERIIKGVKATGKNDKDLKNFEKAMRNWK